MADHTSSPLRNEESITTKEEMDFDDNEHEQETGTISPLGHETPSKTTSSPSPARKSVTFAEEEAPPSKPPRPMDTQQHNEATLIEAFPSIDAKVVKAVLMASGGKLEPAFNALLGMSDPDFKPEEEAPPPRPPRPTQQAPQNQLEADEMYARQLAEQYNGMPRARNQYNQREAAGRRPNQQPQRQFADDEAERNFFDDDLPEIGRNIQQGFFDTQKRVNSWINNFKKRIDGEESDEDLYSAGPGGSRQGQMQSRQNFGSSQSEQLQGIRKQAEQNRRSTTESARYDADPHELGDDEFERLELRDDDQEETPPPRPPRTSSRKTANPDLFKPTPAVPPQSGPVDEVDAADRKSSDTGDKSNNNKKWQSLTSVAPNPEEDNDPFSLGDDDDEAGKGEDLRKEDTDRLKEAARTSVSAGSGEQGQGEKGLVEAERHGSQNLEAKELLSGGSGDQQQKKS